MAVVLTDAQKAKLVKVEQLATFKSLADNKYQDKILAAATQDSFSSATTVEAALIELANKAAGDEVSFEKLGTANTGKLATYRFTKGTGDSAITMDIDIEKDLVNKNFQLVSITEGTEDNAGKYFDGVTEVTSAQGVTGAGVYMKYVTYASGSATEIVSYADMSNVIEFLTVGTQSGKDVTLTIDSTNHTITADLTQTMKNTISGKAEKSEMSIVDVVGDSTKKTITLKSGLSQDVLVAHQNISGKADKVSSATEGNFAGLDANGNLVDSGKKASDFQVAGSYKTVQTAVADIATSAATAETGSTVYFLSGISQNANGEISASKKKIEIANDDDIRAIYGLDPVSNS